MAITQQLARAAPEFLERCRADVRLLDELCSFSLLDADDHLDLDWAPGMWSRVARLMQLSEHLRSTLDRSTAGDAEVNPACRDVSGSVFEHPVNALSADAVADVDAGLRAIAETGFPVVAAVGRARQAVRAGDTDIGDSNYLQGHFAALRRFYDVAARRGLCVVMWWD